MRPESTFRIAGMLATLVITVASVASAGVVISEFRTRGPSGGNDEFVEIWNNSAAAANISGWTLRGSNNAGTTTIRATVPAATSIGPGCYYLFTNNNASGPYSGATAGNQTYSTGFTDDGGLAIVDASAVIVDQAGMSAGSAYKEGATLAPTTLNNNQSYERKPGGGSGNSLDTNNNATDFLFNASSSNPQNSQTCLAATPTRTETWGKVKSFYR